MISEKLNEIMSAMIVICPKCGTKRNYNPRKKQKRRRKDCSCGFRLEVKYDRIVNMGIDQVNMNDQELTCGQKMTIPEVNLTVGKVNLDDKDKQLIQLLQENKYQSQIASILHISKAAVSKRIKKLKEANIIVGNGSKPIFYTFNPQFTQLRKEHRNDGKIFAIETHKMQVKCEVTGNFDKFDEFKKKSTERSKMKNWEKKYLKINDLNLEINTKCIIFWVTGIGKSSQESITNAKTKAVDVFSYLQEKFGLLLGFPEFLYENGNQKPHFVPFKSDPAVFDILGKIWNDKSHVSWDETDNPTLADILLILMQFLNHAEKHDEMFDSLQKFLNFSNYQANIGNRKDFGKENNIKYII